MKVHMGLYAAIFWIISLLVCIEFIHSKTPDVKKGGSVAIPRSKSKTAGFSANSIFRGLFRYAKSKCCSGEEALTLELSTPDDRVIDRNLLKETAEFIGLEYNNPEFLDPFIQKLSRKLMEENAFTKLKILYTIHWVLQHVDGKAQQYVSKSILQLQGIQDVKRKLPHFSIQEVIENHRKYAETVDELETITLSNLYLEYVLDYLEFSLNVGNWSRLIKVKKCLVLCTLLQEMTIIIQEKIEAPVVKVCLKVIRKDLQTLVLDTFVKGLEDGVLAGEEEMEEKVRQAIQQIESMSAMNEDDNEEDDMVQPQVRNNNEIGEKKTSIDKSSSSSTIGNGLNSAKEASSVETALPVTTVDSTIKEDEEKPRIVTPSSPLVLDEPVVDAPISTPTAATNNEQVQTSNVEEKQQEELKPPTTANTDTASSSPLSPSQAADDDQEKMKKTPFHAAAASNDQKVPTGLQKLVKTSVGVSAPSISNASSSSKKAVSASAAVNKKTCSSTSNSSKKSMPANSSKKMSASTSATTATPSAAAKISKKDTKKKKQK